MDTTRIKLRTKEICFMVLIFSVGFALARIGYIKLENPMSHGARWGTLDWIEEVAGRFLVGVGLTSGFRVSLEVARQRSRPVLGFGRLTALLFFLLFSLFSFKNTIVMAINNPNYL